MTTAMDASTLFQFFPLNTSSSIHDKFIRPGSFVYVFNRQSEKWVDVVNAAALGAESGAGHTGGGTGQQPTSAAASNSSLQAELKKEQSENQVFKLY